VDADAEEERAKKQKAFEEKYTSPMTVVTPVLEQGCFTSHLLSFDNNKVLKIINWIC